MGELGERVSELATVQIDVHVTAFRRYCAKCGIRLRGTLCTRRTNRACALRSSRRSDTESCGSGFAAAEAVGDDAADVAVAAGLGIVGELVLAFGRLLDEEDAAAFVLVLAVGLSGLLAGDGDGDDGDAAASSSRLLGRLARLPRPPVSESDVTVGAGCMAIALRLLLDTERAEEEVAVDAALVPPSTSSASSSLTFFSLPLNNSLRCGV